MRDIVAKRSVRRGWNHYFGYVRLNAITLFCMLGGGYFISLPMLKSLRTYKHNVI